MAIRKAKRGDLHAMAEVAAAAFMDEELFGDLMHPHRREYPEDFKRYFENKFLGQWYDRKSHFLVGLDKVSAKVIAFAVWERESVPADASASWSGFLNIDQFQKTATSYYIETSQYMWPNRAADSTKLRILEETFPLFSHHWSGSREQRWYLDMLGTHPEYQGQGIGRELVQWGVDQATKENVCASLIAALDKDRFYGKFGFVEVGRANVGLLEENGIKGGTIMIREAMTPELKDLTEI